MMLVKITNTSNYLIVDNEDYDKVRYYSWHEANKIVRAKIEGKTVSIGNFILLNDSALEPDHINRNYLDNQKSNLRLATRAQNCQNRGIYRNNKSKYKGVSWNKQKRKWVAQIQVNKKVIYLGSFDNPEDAAKTYDSNAKLNFKEFAVTNF